MIKAILNDRKYAKKELEKIFLNYNLTALLFPANFGAHITAKALCPSITIPDGYTSKGPIGITFSSLEF